MNDDQKVCRKRNSKVLTFIILLRWLVDDGAVFQTSQIKHSHTAIRSAAHKNVDAVGAKPHVEHLFIMSDKLSFGSQGWNVPDCTGCIDT